MTPVYAMEKKPASTSEYFVYFGTYTGPKSKGIYVSRFDPATGRLSPAVVAAEADSPAFLAVHPTEKFLYAIDEGSDPVRKPGRGVSAYALDRSTGRLTLLNYQTSGGEAPCHLSLDAAGQSVVVANYTGGSVASLPVLADGRLGPLRSLISHEGSSIHPSRQKKPHAHCFTLSPDDRFAFSADLGIDRIVAYRLDAATATLTPAGGPAAAVPPGSGPRHLAFHPTGKFVYVINELLCTLSVFGYDPARGELRAMENLSTLPAGVAVQPNYSTAEVVAHPNGKFVYGSNRGHDTIAVFAVDAVTGKLALVEHQSTRGKTPRHFAVDPAGSWLLAENQDSDTVAVFRIDPVSGRLAAVGEPLAVPSPVCAVFVRAN
ncbi:MAG: 6-phosphogluconolactonase [Verrucomicrobiota bacterium]